MQTEFLLTINESCQAASIGRTNLYKLINSGMIKAVKVGRKTLIPRSALTEWFNTLPPYKSEVIDA
jgi:excisionase family DNA binding protein